MGNNSYMQNIQRRTLFTDGEGPIVFKDLAQDILGRATFHAAGKNIPGKDFFSILSFYDDYCAEVNRRGYQAGDSLALVVPHFLFHGITDEIIAQEASDAKVVRGVKEYIGGLKKDGWNIRIISTAYRPMWNLVGKFLTIPPNKIAS